MYHQIFPGYLYYPQYQCYLPSVPTCSLPFFPNNQQPKTIFTMKANETSQSQYQNVQNEKKLRATKATLKQESDLVTDKQEKTIETSVSVQQGQEKNVSLKPNLLVDSTNVQKNFSKAIIQYILRQKNKVFKILGEEKGKAFLELMNKLMNKLRNLFHIVKYTEDEDFLKAIRILGYLIALFQEKFSEKGKHQLYLQFKNQIEDQSSQAQGYCEKSFDEVMTHILFKFTNLIFHTLIQKHENFHNSDEEDIFSKFQAFAKRNRHIILWVSFISKLQNQNDKII